MEISFINIFNTFIFWPLFEYWLHYALHIFEESRHKTHHIEVHSNNLKSFKSFSDLEYFYIILPILYLLNFPILFLGSSWYFTVHSIIHFKPELLPTLSNHHLTHHKYPSYNFAITNTYIDWCFNTLKN